MHRDCCLAGHSNRETGDSRPLASERANMTSRNTSWVPANSLTWRRLLTASAIALAALAGCADVAAAEVSEQLSHTAESIHQEVVFHASPARVYAALTTTRQFDAVVRLSAAMQSGMSLGTKPTAASREVGGAFSLFGGYVVGRQIELVPNLRIVQAWRAGSWDAGTYSIARFQLSAQGSDSTLLVFDHTGFPSGQGEHLAEGWRTNYWEPLAKFLAEASAPAPAKAK
jgi:activator of HSP90 ATPase